MQKLSREIRWRMILGETEASASEPQLEGEALAMDETLSALYSDRKRQGGLEDSTPQVQRWLGDIRKYFPNPVVQLMQRDALEQLGLTRMLLEPELLDLIIPNAHLISTLLSLSDVLPDESRESARALVRRYADELLQRLQAPLIQSMRGSLYKLRQTRRPRMREIDWQRTIHANLRHYQPEWKTVIPERLFGRHKSAHQVRQLFLLVDQSGSMGASVVHAGILASVLASLPGLHTRLVVFDTSVVELTAYLEDPVELLFATQLGGGTNIGQALAFARQEIAQPAQTVLVLISDLVEGGAREAMFTHIQALKQSGVQLIVLLSLDDDGAPAYDHTNAIELAALDIPAFACSPDRFPDLMAAALEQRDLTSLASKYSGLVQKN